MNTFRPVTIQLTAMRCLRQAMIVAVLLPAILLVAVPTAIAQDPSMGEAVTITNTTCMQEATPFELGCTANDIQVAGVATDPNGDFLLTILDDGCAFPGDTVTFEAVFNVVTTAKRRHDIGIYFATDGDPNGDGALTSGPGIPGTNDGCSISTMAYAPEPDWLDLDGTDDDPNGAIQDTCGDIDKPQHNPLQPLLTITAVCVDFDGNGTLNLPNCTSWRQAGANELCLGPADTFPGSPSKCRCDEGFEVPIDVPPAELTVVKTANPTSVNEPGATVRFTVDITNDGVDPNNNVTITGLTDDIHGDLLDPTNTTVTNNTCLTLDTVIGSGETVSCSFDAVVSGNGGDLETDTVTAQGQDDNNNPPVFGSDDATVTIVDVLPAISVTKTANPTSVLEGAGETVTFTVVVSNESIADPLTLTSLTDDIHGDLNGQGSCVIGGTIALGGSYTCSFTAVVDGQAFTSETDTVTAVGVDDEFVDDATTPNNKVTAADSATVTILDDVAMIELIKTADPTSVNEPGDDVTFTFTVNNLSNVDTVTINSLTDNIYGDLNGQGDCSVPQVLPPTTGTYTCSITVEVVGDAGDIVTNVATAAGVDDDGQPVMASDDATVNIVDVPPAASLTKTPSMMVVTFDVVVTNDSGAETLFLDSLEDDQFGDITTVHDNVLSTTCSPAQQPIAVGESYTCSFEGKVSTSPHTDVVTGTVSDNEGGQVTPSDSATVTFQSNP